MTGGVPRHRAGCQPCSGAVTAMCLSCYSLLSQDPAVFSRSICKLLHFVFTYMWAGKVIKGSYLFTFPLSLLVWFGTGAKGHVSLWLRLGYMCCRSLAILWGLELSIEWFQGVPGIPLPWREFCHYFALLVGCCFASDTAYVDWKLCLLKAWDIIVYYLPGFIFQELIKLILLRAINPLRLEI